MPPAIIGGAIAAGGAVASAKIGSSGAKSAAQASENAANTSAQVQREQFQGAQNALMPFQQAGLPATQQINALLGLGGGTGSPGQTDWGAYVNGNADALANWNAIKGNSDGAQFGGDINAFGRFHYQNDGSTRDLSSFNSGAVSASSADAARAAFEQFRNSTGYDWRVKQGMNALNSGYAGAGTLKSGAAIKGAVDYGQGMASQEFGNYLGALGNQQALGLSAGSALAGVGQNYANSLGNIYMQNGANQANSALVRSANTGQAVNSLAGIAGNVFGGTNFGGGGGVNMNALNAGTAAYSPALASPYAGQTNDWRTW